MGMAWSTRIRRSCSAAAIAAASAGMLSALPAHAARPATAPELAALAASQNLDPACMIGKVSTVDATWARMEGRPDASPDACALGNGFFVMHETNGAWDDVAQASETIVCQSPDNTQPIPISVGRDLNVCRAAKTYLLCLPKNGALRTAREHPTSCTTLGPADSLGGAANLAELRWHNWGKATAIATGRERGFHLPLQNIPVRVVAYRRRAADCGDSVYTRLRITSRYGTLRQKLPATCGDPEP
jgi:hypothetical protein